MAEEAIMLKVGRLRGYGHDPNAMPFEKSTISSQTSTALQQSFTFPLLISITTFKKLFKSHHILAN